jgi:hypothetical protein
VENCKEKIFELLRSTAWINATLGREKVQGFMEQ